MENTLSLTLKQQLRLSQMQIQKLEMLALNYDELEEAIRKEEETNPFLEVRAGKYSAESTYRPIDYSLDYLSKGDEDEKSGWMERAISVKESLYDHLRMQIETIDMPKKVREASLIIASALSPKGFLPDSLENILPTAYLDVKDDALKVIQSLDPTGVGASDYKESLKIQLRALHLQKSDEDHIEYMIDNMDLIKGGRTDAISKKLDIDEEEASLLIGILKSLTPYPGEKYNCEYETYIHPDIAIKKNSSGELEIIDYSDNLPDVRLSAEYVALEDEMKEDKKKNKEALSFLKANRDKAEAIIDSINLRTTSLHKIALYLVNKQRPFFEKGISFLRPDTQQNMAASLELSASTVSRLCSKKYIETDWGTFPVSFFFSSTKGFQKSDEEEMSKNAIKARIKELIESHEGKKAPSDQKISDILKEEGISIARRTVAKYRAELDIDTSYNR